MKNYPLTTLFSTLNYTHKYSLLYAYYGEEYVKNRIKEEKNEEAVVAELLFGIQEEAEEINVSDIHTGEFYVTIPLVPANLSKTMEKLLAGCAFNYHRTELSAHMIHPPAQTMEEFEEEMRKMRTDWIIDAYAEGFFDGNFGTSHPVNYKYHGVRVHTVDSEYCTGMNCPWHMAIEIVDHDTGRTTDEFYGAYTDFREWFAAKAARGDRFKVFVYPLRSNEGIQQWNVFTKFGTIARNPDGSWSKVEYEPLEISCGKHQLMNYFYRDEISPEENRKEIEKSLTRKGTVIRVFKDGCYRDVV